MLSSELRSVPYVDSKREALLDAAIELFSEKAYEDVSVDELARRAGVAHGTVSYHFKSKRGLFAEAVARVYDDFVKFEAPTGDEKLVSDVIRGYLKRHFAYVRRHPQRFFNLMGGNHVDDEVTKILEQARAAAMMDIRIALGCPLEMPSTLGAALIGWRGYVDSVTLRWLGDKSLDPGTVIEMCVQVLIASIASTKGLYFPAEIEEKLLSDVASASFAGKRGSR